MNPRKIELRVGQVCSMIGTILTGREINELLGIEKEFYHSKYTLSDVRALRLKLKKPASVKSPLTIAIHSRSAGDGKTTLAANIGASFAWKGMRTLLIDGDSCGELSAAVHVNMFDRRNVNIVDVMRGKSTLKRATQNIYTDGMLDIISSTPSLSISDVHMSLSHSPMTEFKDWLASNMDDLCAQYDVIVIDTSSYPTRLTYNLLLGADLIVNTIRFSNHALLESNALREFYTASESYEDVTFPPTIYIANGVQPAFSDTETILRGLAEQHAGQLCDVVIPLHTMRKVPEKFSGIIAEKEPGSYVTQCFFSVTDSILKHHSM